MARIRSLKPEFFSSEQVVGVSIPARYLWEGMWVFGDDDGYIAASPLQLKMKVFPGDMIDVEPLLAELEGSELIERVETDQGPVFYTPSFRDHQRPKYPTTTKYTVNGVPLGDSSPRVPPAVRKRSGSGSEVVPPKSRGEESRGEIKNVAEPRADVLALCDLLADLIAGNGSPRPTVSKAWMDAARLMLDKDKREFEKSTNLIRWCQENSFWRSAVMSMPKFRDQYDQMRLQALRDFEKDKPKADPDAWMNR